MIIIIIIAVAILSWYGVDLKKFIESPAMQRNFGYIWDFISGVWSDYLAGPASKLWDIVVIYIWGPLMDVIKK